MNASMKGCKRKESLQRWKQRQTAPLSRELQKQPKSIPFIFLSFYLAGFKSPNSFLFIYFFLDYLLHMCLAKTRERSSNKKKTCDDNTFRLDSAAPGEEPAPRQVSNCSSVHSCQSAFVSMSSSPSHRWTRDALKCAATVWLSLTLTPGASQQRHHQPSSSHPPQSRAHGELLTYGERWNISVLRPPLGLHDAGSLQ